MPETIAIWLLTTFGTANAAGVVVVAGSTVSNLAFAIKAIIATAASMAASKLLAPKMPSFGDSSISNRSQMVRSPISSRNIVYGRCRVSGTMVYLSVTGSLNEYLHIVLALVGHEVQEIEEIYFNDEVVPLSGNVPIGFYSSCARVNKHLGEPGQTADADLIADTAFLVEGQWTADHKLSGIAYVYVRLKWDAEKFPAGIPNVSAVVRGKKVLDTRTGTTAFSANAAMCLRDYLTDSALGMGLDATEIDTSSFNAAANICDEQVQILPLSPVVTENRYEANGAISTSAPPEQNIGALMSAMGGLIAYSGGKIVAYAGGYRIPTVSLDEKHLVGPFSVVTKTSARDRVNTVKGVYVSETNAWQPSDFPIITAAGFVAEDNGIKYTRDVVLPFTTSPSCAQRLAVIELRRARQEITMSSRFRLEAMQLRAGDTVMITNEELGFVNKVFEVMDWHFATDGNPPQLYIDMTLRETDSSVYSFTVADEILVNDLLQTTLPDPFTLSAPTNLVLTADSTTQFLQIDGTTIPRIKVEWTPPAEEFIQSGGVVVIEYKPTASTTYLTWTRVEGTQDEDFISGDVQVGNAYDVRIYGESFFQITTDYVTASVTVLADATPPDIPTGATITADGVKPKFLPGTEVFLFGTRVGWEVNNQSNFSHFEVKATLDDDPDSTSYTWLPFDGNNFVTTRENETFLYNASLQPGFVRIRSVNRSGVASAYVLVGNANGIGNSGIGVGNVAAQSSDDQSTTGIRTGGGASTRQINVVFSDSTVPTLVGGAPTETFELSLTNRGFSAKPDIGVVQCASDANIVAAYDFDAAANSSVTAVIRVATIDGNNIGAGLYRFSLEFTDFS